MYKYFTRDKKLVNRCYKHCTLNSLFYFILFSDRLIKLTIKNTVDLNEEENKDVYDMLMLQASKSMESHNYSRVTVTDEIKKLNQRKTIENYLNDRKGILQSSGEYQCLFLCCNILGRVGNGCVCRFDLGP